MVAAIRSIVVAVVIIGIIVTMIVLSGTGAFVTEGGGCRCCNFICSTSSSPKSSFPSSGLL